MVQVKVVGRKAYPPVFRKPQYDFQLRWNGKVGVLVGKVTAHSRDSSSSGGIRYKLDDNVADRLRINATSGEIRTGPGLSRDSADPLTATVFAVGGGSPGAAKTASAQVRITLYPTGGKIPLTFHYRFAVDESASVGTTVGRVFAAPGPGARAVRYRLDRNTSQLTVDEATGVVSVAAPLDREAGPTVSSTVYAEVGADSLATETASTSVVVELRDVNDCAPQFQDSEIEISIPEGPHAATDLPRQVQATDCDATAPNNKITYRMGASPFARHFEVKDDKLPRLREGEFDRETMPQFRIALEAHDGGWPRHSTVVNLLVRITDVNDNAPHWIFPVDPASQVVVNVSGPSNYLIVQVQANDADEGINGTVKYGMESARVPSPFGLDPNTGRLTLTRSLQPKDVGLWPLKLTAFDGGQPRLSSKTKLLIRVIDPQGNGRE